MVSVKITCTIEVRRGGEVMIRHQDPSGVNAVGLFGFPGRELTPAEAVELCRNIKEFVRERFSLEVAAALKEATEEHG